MPFRKYDKIHRLGKDEVDGILDGEVFVQEKIDGANTSIWLIDVEDFCLGVGSRNRYLDNDGFNGFNDYANEHKGICDLLDKNRNFILYGEWLVKHTVQYHQDVYKHWYMFDIWDEQKQEYLHPTRTIELAGIYHINTPWYMGNLVNPTKEQLQELVGKSGLGDKGEGIVIKNPNFINRWGNKCHAKLVTQDFMENNALIFGGNNKAAEHYTEMYIIHKYMLKARVEKICNKIQPEINEKLDMCHIPRITNTAFYDMITEEAWEIAKLNKTIDYKALKSLAMKKAKLLYMEIIGVV